MSVPIAGGQILLTSFGITQGITIAPFTRRARHMSSKKLEIRLVDIESGEVMAQYVGTNASAKRMIKEYAIYGYYLEAR
jgi:hypothetical protein